MRTPHPFTIRPDRSQLGFADRREAGRLLADELRQYAGQLGLLVLGLPRGGVPVAYEVARALEAPLDVCVVRKLGVPGREEIAMGAIATGGGRVLNRNLIEQLEIPMSLVENVTVLERRELERRERLYRGARPSPDIRGRTVIVVDDGLATGATMFAAVGALRQQGPASIIVAAPVGSLDACAALRSAADACVCVLTPEPLQAIGMWYADFGQTTDEEVRALLADAERGHATGEPRARFEPQPH
jgi:predicted phosphoribosyltransferase